MHLRIRESADPGLANLEAGGVNLWDGVIR